MLFNRCRLLRETLLFLFLLSLGVLTACADEPQNEMAVLPATAVEPTALKLLPTPTLDARVSTRPPPTPEITPTVGNTPTPAYLGELGQSAGELSLEELSVDQRVVLAESAQQFGDYDTAVEQFSTALQQDPQMGIVDQGAVLYDLGVAYQSDGRFSEAATMFHQLLTLPGGDPPPETHFRLAEVAMSLGDWETAVSEYRAYLESSPDMAAYVQPRIADAYLALGDSESALEAYKAALEGPAYRIKEVQTRLILAEHFLDAGEYELAIAQYDAVHDLAQTEATRGQMTYLAGAAHLLAGNTQEAYERFLFGVESYPKAYESYLGLVELVKAEQEVDSFQRGLVDFYAAAYAPGIDAFEEHINANLDGYNPESHYYLALSHEALGELTPALAELELYAEFEPAKALLERAKMQGRAGDLEAAAALYQQFLAEYPDDEEAPFAAWWAASYLEQLDKQEEALVAFIQLAEDYPDHDDAPEALLNAGRLAQMLDDQEQADALWLQAAETYPDTRSGSAAMVRLLLAEPDRDSELFANMEELVAEHRADHYYALRTADIISGTAPFTADADFALPDDQDAAVRAEMDAWILEQVDSAGVEGEGSPGDLGPNLLEDSRLVVGQKLWELGLFEEAKRELEDLRADYSDSILDSYQLALFFRDLGLYRSSIIAAASVLNQLELSVLEVPKGLGRLAYPIYYAQEILPLAKQYGYDPRLQFSLVRQESLFESFATSGAAAQGLSQVIPDTGAWIAERLQWPDYVNEDLYKPYVGLAFGAYYLSEQLKAFDGDVHAALAAYNAGPGNGARWQEEAGSDIDQFVDVIDYPETLAYVERIYAGFDIYRYLYAP